VRHTTKENTMRYEISVTDIWNSKRSLGKETSRSAAETVANNIVMLAILLQPNEYAIDFVEVLDTKRNEVVYSRKKEKTADRYSSMVRI
jgi:hypothetical protein